MKPPNKYPAQTTKGNIVIGVSFGDNDFYRVMMSFGELFLGSELALRPENITKKRIVDLWNALAPGLYWLRQNGYQYETSYKETAHIEKYLQITSKKVYLGDEVINLLNKEDWQNGEFVYVDIAAGKVIVC